jgi:RHS repeat-associated protein
MARGGKTFNPNSPSPSPIQSGTSNRLSPVSGALVRSYSYDLAGNSLTTGATTHTYYNSGRMKTAKLGAASATTYTYNALGQRVKKNGPGGGFYYVYDEAGHLQGEYTSGGGTQEETVWLGDIPIATLRPNVSGGAIVYYVQTDQLNTPRKVTNNDFNLTVRWTWDPTPFGEGAPFETLGGHSQFKYNLRFPGQMLDAESGLNYNYFRDYDPAIGRYLESDPLGLRMGNSLYPYARGNPPRFSDPLGLSSIDELDSFRNCMKAGGHNCGAVAFASAVANDFGPSVRLICEGTSKGLECTAHCTWNQFFGSFEKLSSAVYRETALRILEHIAETSAKVWVEHGVPGLNLLNLGFEAFEIAECTTDCVQK